MPDHHIRLRYSDDGGHTQVNWREASIGEVGQYGVRPIFDRLGQFTQRTMTITCSSPRKRDFLGAVVTIKAAGG